jgi:hypothetical protein
VVLSGENGLLAAKPAVSLPQDMQYVGLMAAGEKPAMYEVEALLTPKLYSDSVFQIDADDLPGMWRVISGSHVCDGASFLTSLRVTKA